jgi:hypothetical protein
VPTTALAHFNHDISRARAILQHAQGTVPTTDGEVVLRDDLFRSAWMFAVGAFDAYACDAYADIVAAVLIAPSRERSTCRIPFDVHNKIILPVANAFKPYPQNHNWAWRMATRKMMEKEHITSIITVKALFNPFLPDNQRFFTGVARNWAAQPSGSARLFDMPPGTFVSTYDASTEKNRKKLRARVAGKIASRFDNTIFQRRHDCIHQCDRPKYSLQRIHSAGTVSNVIDDIEFLVHGIDAHLQYHVRQLLLNQSVTAASILAVGY